MMGFPPEQTVGDDGPVQPAETVSPAPAAAADSTVAKVEHAAEDAAELAGPVIGDLVLPEGAPAWLADALHVIHSGLTALAGHVAKK